MAALQALVRMFVFLSVTGTLDVSAPCGEAVYCITSHPHPSVYSFQSLVTVSWIIIVHLRF